MFICCGDVLVDLFSQPTQVAGKVALQGHVGGSPLNVAVGLARLGNTSGFLCKNSTDFMGQAIAEYLQVNGVKDDWITSSTLNSTLAMVQTNDDGSANYAFYTDNTADLSMTVDEYLQVNGVKDDWITSSTLNSTLAMVQTNDDGSANYAFYTDNTADLSMTVDELPEAFPAEFDVLHFGSYSTAVEPTSSTLAALAKRESKNCVISYDPNIRPTIEPDTDIWREKFAAFSAAADFVKASDEDIGLLFGPGKSFDSFAADTLAAGAAAVAITEGNKGVTIYAADGREVRSDPITISVADTVGAGDTFQAASLHWLRDQNCIANGVLSVANVDLSVWANFAAGAAAITCTRHGADLPTLDEVQQWLSERT